MRDDRHARHRRAEPDRRRRPVDGFRTADRGRFGRLVEDALAELPPSFLEHLDGTMIAIEDVPPVPSDDDAGEVALATYVAASVRGGSRRAPAPLLTLYRRPLEARATSKRDLAAIVREITVLEVAEHLGIDDDQLDDLGWL